MTNILTVYGGGTGEGLLPVEAHSEDFSITGYVSPPSKNRSGRKCQVFFINVRPVTDKAMERGLYEAYRETLFEGRHPIAFLFLQAPPGQLDVNVHPAKSEVRLDDEDAVIKFVAAAVRKAILVKNAIAPPPPGAGTAGAPGAVRRGLSFPEDGGRSQGAAETGGGSGALTRTDGEDPERAAGAYDEKTTNFQQVDIINLLSNMRRRETAPAELLMEDEEEWPDGVSKPFEISAIEPLTTLFSTYITGVDRDSFYFIDQHAAHERVLYEQFMGQRLNRERPAQPLLAPFVVESPFYGGGDLSECLAMLASLGYEAEEFGPKALYVRAIPAFMSISRAGDFLRAVLDDAQEIMKTGSAADIERVISSACKKAVKANDHLEEAEIRALLASLERCENPYYCPHGRPVFVRMRKRDVERMFKRL
jgi:DNA mismatch repair protein MutL